MIPKKIHYCWFGRGPKDKLFEKCYKSWQKYFPDWEIIEWNEDNFDVDFCEYTKRAYELGKYAFVSDVARLKAVYDEGGIYFDTDVEVIKLFSKDILKKGYFAEEEDGLINTGLGFAAKEGDKAVKMLLNSYKNLKSLETTLVPLMKKRNLDDLIEKFHSADKDDIYAIPCPLLNSAALMAKGYDIKDGACLENVPVYGPEYFCGYDLKNHHYMITDKTFSVHHYAASWQTKKYKRITSVKHCVSNIIGAKNYARIRQLKHRLKNEKQ